MLRGINRQSIFEDDHDRHRFVRILEEYREEVIDEERTRIFDVYAWVIMGNHVHLVLRFLRENPSIQHVMKRICVAYSFYYNRKNARIGPVFQDRYRSEPIEDERYLFNVVRYVHMNPVKAGMCGNPIEYEWSSYREYMHKRSVARIVDWSDDVARGDGGAAMGVGKGDGDTAVAKDVARGVTRGTVLLETINDNNNGTTLRETFNGSNREMVPMETIGLKEGEMRNRMKSGGTAEFEKWTMEEDEGIYLEMCQERRKTMSDDTVREKMKEYGCSSIEAFRELGRDEKIDCMRLMLDKGAGISQISRVTGISRPTIRKMVR